MCVLSCKPILAQRVQRRIRASIRVPSTRVRVTHGPTRLPACIRLLGSKYRPGMECRQVVTSGGKSRGAFW
eukprot:scaffold1620_cov420-Prasinococcus_capsulatus_cf.AAC.3